MGETERLFDSDYSGDVFDWYRMGETGRLFYSDYRNRPRIRTRLGLGLGQSSACRTRFARERKESLPARVRVTTSTTETTVACVMKRVADALSGNTSCRARGGGRATVGRARTTAATMGMPLDVTTSLITIGSMATSHGGFGFGTQRRETGASQCFHSLHIWHKSECFESFVPLRQL